MENESKPADFKTLPGLVPKKIRNAAVVFGMIVVFMITGTLATQLWNRHLTRRGEALTDRVFVLVTEADNLVLDGKRQDAAEKLTEAVEALAKYEETRAHRIYPLALFKLSALLLQNPAVTNDEVKKCIGYLEAAWQAAPENDADLRAAIARDRGLAEAANGDLNAATDWYRRSTELKPSDKSVKERLEFIERIKSLAKKTN